MGGSVCLHCVACVVCVCLVPVSVRLCVCVSVRVSGVHSQVTHKWHSILKEDGIVRQRIVVKYFPHTAPERSSLETSVGPWRAAGVPDVHRALPQREYGRTKVSECADSTVRDILASQGGYFFTDFHCHTNTTESSFLAVTTRTRYKTIPHFLD